jgi:hypothetical protein
MSTRKRDKIGERTPPPPLLPLSSDWKSSFYILQILMPMNK